MLDDRVLRSASVLEVGDELVVRLVDDIDSQGVAVARNAAGVMAPLSAMLTAQIGRDLISEGQRWADRPRNGGVEWIAFSAVASGLTALSAAAAGVSLRQWLGGTLRDPAGAIDHDSLGVECRAVGDASFDEIAAWLPGASVGSVSVDPRLWSIPAITRLDALCRVLQVGLAIELPVGSLAGPLAEDLLAALPMATLRRRFDAERRSPNGQGIVFSVGQVAR